jgi:site-specific DNA recombinase
MKYFIYIRKSSDREDHQILSIGSQTKVLEELAAKMGVQVVAIYKEEKTAYKTGRPKFNEMLARIERGEADGIIVYHLTRIARNSFDGGRVIYMMDEGTLKEIITPETTYTNLTDHKFLMQIHFAMAKKSSDDTSTFVKRDNQTKLEKGELIGLASLGYLNIDKEGRIAGKRYTNEKQVLLAQLGRPLKRTEIDPIDGPLVKKVLEKAATGTMSASALLEYANEIGLKNIAKNTLFNMFTNPNCYGSIKSKGKIYQGDFDALISKKTFDQIQDMLKNKSKPRKQIHRFPYVGIMRCDECGSMITAEIQKGHVYYRCSKKKGKCKQPYLRSELLEKQLKDYLEKVQIPDAFIKWASKQLQSVYKDEVKVQASTRMSAQQELNRLKKKQAKLLEEYLSSDSVLTKEEYSEQKQKVLTEICLLEENMQAHSGEEVKWIGDCEDFFEFSSQLLNRFDTVDIEEKRFVLQAIGSNFVLKNRQLTLEYQKIYKPFLKLNEFESQNRLEPEKPDVEATKSHFARKIALWGERWGSNPRPPGPQPGALTN